MLLNYIRIQLLRFFKGKTWIVVLLTALFAVGIGLLAGIYSYNYVNPEINSLFEDIERNKQFMIQSIVSYFAISFIFPYTCGIITIVYICNYYSYRTHINLEIKIRNRILFAISEAVILFIMELMQIGVVLLAELIVSFFVKISVKDLFDMITPGVIYNIILYFISLYAIIMYAYLTAKFFRRKPKAIIFYSVTIYFIYIIQLTLIDKLPMSKYFLGFNYIPGDDAPIYIITILIRIFIIFGAAIMLFQRRYEEKHI